MKIANPIKIIGQEFLENTISAISNSPLIAQIKNKSRIVVIFPSLSFYFLYNYDMFKYSINKDNCQGQRLDKFLAEKFNYSRSFIQRLIKDEGILVNGKKIKQNYLLKENDEIKIDENKIEDIKKAKEVDLSPIKKSLEIIFEDENFLLINKPAGLIVHPSPSHPKETLVNILINYFPQLKNVGEDKLRPGIVHRLDKEASGLLIIAKTQKSFEYLKKQFQGRQIKKEYFVLVHGKIKDKKGIIELPIGRLPQKGFKMSAGYFFKGKPAFTEYELIKYFNPAHNSLKVTSAPELSKAGRIMRGVKDYSLLKVKTKTGRTHQIRVHLKTLGYPVVGDKIYKPRKLKAIELPYEILQDGNSLKRVISQGSPSGIPQGGNLPFGRVISQGKGRIFLHCYKLGFFDLENKWKEFETDLAPELKIFLEDLDKIDAVK